MTKGDVTGDFPEGDVCDILRCISGELGLDDSGEERGE